MALPNVRRLIGKSVEKSVFLTPLTTILDRIVTKEIGIVRSFNGFSELKNVAHNFGADSVINVRIAVSRSRLDEPNEYMYGLAVKTKPKT